MYKYFIKSNVTARSQIEELRKQFGQQYFHDGNYKGDSGIFICHDLTTKVYADPVPSKEHNLATFFAPLRANIIAKYIRLLLHKHFLFFNPHASYGKNTVKYQVQKADKFGCLPQLVVSGYLKRRVLAGRVQANGKLLFDLPYYRIYKIEVETDFLQADSEEKKLMGKWLTQELKTIRAKMRNDL